MTLVQAFTREGFDLGRHPISLLSLGDIGWLQITNFVVTGVLYVACAIGMRRAMRTGRGATWGPRLVGALGVGLIAAGVFVTDAGAGYPPGAPAGAPPEISWHGILHEVGFMIAVFGMIAGCLVFARRFAELKQPAWVAASIATPVAVLGLSFWPDVNGLSVRLVIATAVLFGYVAAVAAHALGDLPVGGHGVGRRSGSKADWRTDVRTISSADGTTIAYDMSATARPSSWWAACSSIERSTRKPRGSPPTRRCRSSSRSSITTAADVATAANPAVRVEREIEDIALIDATAARRSFPASRPARRSPSRPALALDGKVRALAMCEPPYPIDEAGGRRFGDSARRSTAP